MDTPSPKRSIQNRLTVFLLLPILIFSSGCSFLANTHQVVPITATDPRATIFVDGQEVGVGKAAPKLDRSVNHRVRAEVGNRRIYAYIGRSASAHGTFDIVGGLLFGITFVGYFAPGFWELDPPEVTLKVPENRRKCKYCNQ